MKINLITCAFLLALPFVSFAQDFIYFKDGTKMEVKVIETNSLITIYEMPDHPGKNVQMNTDQVAMIQYEDGKATIYLPAEEREAFIAKLAREATRQPNEVSPPKATTYSSPSSSNRQKRDLDKALQGSAYKHSVGLNLATVGSPTKYVYGEYERLLGRGATMSLRLAYYSDYYSDSYYSSTYSSFKSEWEEGIGLGVSYRYYVHGKPKIGGFFVASAVDFIYVEWGWSESYRNRQTDTSDYDGNYGTSLAMAFTGQIGYKFVLGKSIFIEPSVIGGHYASNSSDATIESGVVLMPGLTVGLRLK